MDQLFQKEPQYDENGRLVGYSQPKIMWIILALIVFYCCKDKFMKQKGGENGGISFRNAIILIIFFISVYFLGIPITMLLVLAYCGYWVYNKLPKFRT